MIDVKDKEVIRRAFFVEEKSLREIAREFHHSRKTIRKALASPEPTVYNLQKKRPAPAMDAYKDRLEELLTENETLPRKQRYTGQRIYELLVEAGYTGSASTLRGYVAAYRKAKRRPAVYLPLEFDPGQDAQVDWGEGLVEIAGDRVKVQLFFMHLNYSRRTFVMAFPTQRQEAFAMGHVKAFEFFQGVPHRLTYDNLKTAVQKILEGHTRQEQAAFIQLRSHYLFESYFCNPAQGHEKGGVEGSVGFGRRNYLVPIPKVASWAELNRLLLERVLADDQRTVDRQEHPIGIAWQLEQPHLRPLPAHPFDHQIAQPVTLTPYSQVTFETNRYSVPADQAQKQLLLKADPFEVTILSQERILARHPRSYERNADIFDPLHYLSLLEQRPGALAHAKPLRQWRQRWPEVYEQLLERLRQGDSESQGIREFVRILKLHQDYPEDLLSQAITQALACGCPHLEGVQLCLHQLQQTEPVLKRVDLSDFPQLAQVGAQPPDAHCYEQLLKGRTA